MFDFDYIEEIWATLTRNKWRSFMTAMGVFWAIFMLVIMSGAGFGIEQMIFGNVPIATKSCMFYTQPTSEEYRGLAKGRVWYPQFSDVGHFRESVEGVKHISRQVYTPNATDLKAVKGMRSINIQLEGFEPESRNIIHLDMIYGRYINNLDMSRNRMACSIGIDIYNNLFPEGGDPTGEIINIGRNIFTIIGVHKSPDSPMSFMGDASTMVIAPITTIQKIYNTGENLSKFMVSVEDKYDVVDVEEEIIKKLKQLYDISPTDKKAIMSFNIDKVFKTYENLFLGINILIWIVGIGTLLAGIVGVSNIMLIVVKERTQEIGIRRALGATPYNIIFQIMSESFILTFVTGVASLGISVGLLSVVEIFTMNEEMMGAPFSPQITFSMAISFAVIIIISGLLAGAIPAIRAINIKAVDAIREE